MLGLSRGGGFNAPSPAGPTSQPYNVSSSAPQWAQNQSWQNDPKQNLPYSYGMTAPPPSAVSASSPEGYAVAGGQNPLNDLSYFQNNAPPGGNWNYDAASVTAGGPAGAGARTLFVPWAGVGAPSKMGEYASKWGAEEEMMRQFGAMGGGGTPYSYGGGY